MRSAINLNKKNISVVGLGKLGLPFALCLAKKGFKVIGIDTNQYVIDSLKNGIAPIIEPGLNDLLKKFYHNFHPSVFHKEAIEKTDITFIIVATPSDKTGNFSNKYVESALKSLCRALKESPKKYHLFVIGSTVMPQSLEKRIIPLIEKYSGRKLNKGFGVCYVPDFVALGRVVNDFLNPDFVLIGESDSFAGACVESIYKKLCLNKPPILRTSIINAEIAKMALNVYLTTKISFANTLGNICEKIPGANALVVAQILGMDKRISPFYLKPGLSFGGTCFPRDTKAFMALSKKIKYNPILVKATDKVNEFQHKHLLNIVLKALNKTKSNKVSILGLSFKPDTPVIEESPAIHLIRALLRKKIKIYVYDPLAMKNTEQLFGSAIEYCKDGTTCIKNSSVIVITTPHKEFKNINFKTLKDEMRKKKILIDCWNMINTQHIPDTWILIGFGRYLNL